MSNHTPGPWQVLEEYGEPYSPLLVVAENGYRVARFWLDDAPVFDYNSMQIANAHLVASAPEMKRELELLRELAGTFELQDNPINMRKLALCYQNYRKEFPEAKGEDDAN